LLPVVSLPLFKNLIFDVHIVWCSLFDYVFICVSLLYVDLNSGSFHCFSVACNTWTSVFVICWCFVLYNASLDYSWNMLQEWAEAGQSVTSCLTVISEAIVVILVSRGTTLCLSKYYTDSCSNSVKILKMKIHKKIVHFLRKRCAKMQYYKLHKNVLFELQLLMVQHSFFIQMSFLSLFPLPY